MTDILYRAFQPDLQVRSRGDGRTVYGIAVPWGTPQKINQRLTEQFASGAFDHQLRAANRVKFSREHVTLGGTLIGALTDMRNDAAGLYVEARVSKTPIGDETLELVRDGALDQLSIGFVQPRTRRVDGTVTEVTRANLTEVAVVLSGAYADSAAVAGVRSHGDPDGYPEYVRLEQVQRLLSELPKLSLPPV